MSNSIKIKAALVLVSLITCAEACLLQGYGAFFQGELRWAVIPLAALLLFLVLWQKSQTPEQGGSPWAYLAFGVLCGADLMVSALFLSLQYGGSPWLWCLPLLKLSLLFWMWRNIQAPL